MRYRLLLLLCVLGFTQAHAANDSIYIKGNIISTDSLRYTTVSIEKYTAMQNELVQSYTLKVPDQHFTFAFPADFASGVYSIKVQDLQTSHDIIIDGKERDIQISIYWESSPYILNKQVQKLEIVKSEQNKVWYEYKNKTDELINQMSKTSKLIEETDNADVKNALIQTREKQKADFNNEYNKICKNYAGTLVGDLVKNTPFKIAAYTSLSNAEKVDMIHNYWENFDTENESLLNTNIYQTLAADYLTSYYTKYDGKLTDELQDDLIAAADTTIFSFLQKDDLYHFIVTHLQAVYMSIGAYKGLKYIDENYGGICSDEPTSIPETEMNNFYRKRMESYNLTASGKLAPNIDIKDSNTGAVEGSLYQMPGKYKVIAFWSTTCSHCVEELPKVERYAKTSNSVSVLAVCISNDKQSFILSTTFLPTIRHTWEGGEWDGVSASKYYVTATPTFFIVDSDNKFIGTYHSWSIVENTLNEFLSK